MIRLEMRRNRCLRETVFNRRLDALATIMTFSDRQIARDSDMELFEPPGSGFSRSKVVEGCARIYRSVNRCLDLLDFIFRKAAIHEPGE